MKKRKLFSYGTIPLLALGMIGTVGCGSTKENEVEKPTAVFDKEIATYRLGNPTRTNDGDYKTPKLLNLTYVNFDIDISNYVFFFWATGVDGKELETTTISENQITVTVDLYNNPDYYGKSGVYFIVKKVGTWVGQSEDAYIDFIKLNDYINDEGVINVYALGDSSNRVEISTDPTITSDRIIGTYFTDWKTIHVSATGRDFTSYKLYAFEKGYLSNSPDYQVCNKELYKVASGVPTFVGDDIEFDITSKYNVPANALYLLEMSHTSGRTYSRYVNPEHLYETSMFKTHYTYTGDDLGVTYTQNSSTFKVWAPTAGLIQLQIYDNYDSYTGRVYNMSYHYGGVWACTIEGDLDGKSYTYTVYNSNGEETTTDPYAKACTVNGDRSVVVDFSTTNPDGWDDVPLVWDGVSGRDITTPQELSIYETHIRDLTMHETWTGSSMRGTYNAFVEKGTTYSKSYAGNPTTTVTTGFDHIEELGVKAVQLLPVFDGDNDERLDHRKYDWGYNPLNYNCVEGVYSSNPTNPKTRITEYKNLIQQFANNKNKTRIIMDVVYNHVSNAKSSCFEKLMPHYYFRMLPDGRFADCSGCGNEVKSEAPMMSKYIVDSLKWWATEYKVKGFRFDLMGLIDHKTMIKAAQELYKIDPDIYLYGEGWSATGTTSIDQTYHSDCYPSFTNNVYSYLMKSGNMCYIGCFNDGGRNAIRGDNYIWDGSGHFYPGYGFISQGDSDVGDKSTLVGEMLLGRNTNSSVNNQSPLQTINYASCHDNYTLFDQFSFTLANGGTFDSDCLAGSLRASTICNIAVMMSNGVAFMQGGEELFRTKALTTAEDLDKGVYEYINGIPVSHNSYNLSDSVNAYDWSRKISVSYKGYEAYTKVFFDSLKETIALRSDFKFRSNTSNEGHPCNYWDNGDNQTKLAWFFESKSGKNNTMGYKLCISGRYAYPNSVWNGDSDLVTNVGQYTLRTNSGAQVSLGMYACVVTRTPNE